jgi:hypothetical protein
MGEKRPVAEPAPQIVLRQVGAVRAGALEYWNWNVHWQVENRGEQPLKILAALLPHGQFKAEETRFDPPLDLAPRAHERFQTSVRCHEPGGLVTENAFVIFHVNWSGKSWRIFARVRVEVDDSGVPKATTEAITTQKVGFSGISS